MIAQVPQAEFDEAIERDVDWASEWDGAVPADVFFGIWADFQRDEQPVEVRARIVEGHLQLSPMSGSSIRAEDNRIWLEDGRELVIRLERV